ncbi:hypothetical protein [Curtobacterium sp. MCLR17_034]|uniref:VG15 protein n=1 Tax=Curtobacterium sp. MCLR17_034 TaxID=2175623 RepID=UPI0011B4D014|nr:hypothetical protein [Curtobacterium sp. MCLR17_034]
MPTALESRRALTLVADVAVSTSLQLLRSTSGSAEQRRYDLLGGIPEVVSYYQDGSAALAADFYDDERDLAGVAGSFTTDLVIVDRTVKLRRAIAWSAEPLFDGDDVLAGNRLAGVVQLETARSYRDTVTGNTERDPQAVGWRRVASGGCKFCAMLAARGAVYTANTARFAAHEHCHCTAAPAFVGYDGPEASTVQYVASKKNRTPAQRAQLREYLNENFTDLPG